jgi:hypothetical protein
MLHQDCAESSFGLASGLRPCMSAPASRRYAEAGALPSSKAPPEEPLEAIGRRRISTKRRVARLVGRCTWESDSPEGARFVSRLQKLVRRIFPVRTACEVTRSRKTG